MIPFNKNNSFVIALLLSSIGYLFAADPPLPDLSDLEQFEALVDVSVSQPEPVYSVRVVELYDDVYNRGALDVELNDTSMFKVRFQYDTDELFQILDNECWVSSITNTSKWEYFGYETVNGSLHIYGVSDLFKFGEKYNETYLGNDFVIRGINAMAWSAEIKGDVDGVKFDLITEYYFSDPDWPIGIVQTKQRSLPLGALVTGNVTNATATYYTETYYSFEIFPKTFSQNYEGFLIPKGVFCSGKKNTKDVPDVPSRFFFVEEAVTSVDGVGSYQTMVVLFYEYNSKLLKAVIVTENNPTGNITALDQIHDYNSGIAFEIDYIKEICNVLPLSEAASGWEANTNTSTAGNKTTTVTWMKDPMELFGFDRGEHYYVGQRMHRGLLCDVWSLRFLDTANVTGAPVVTNQTWEYYFFNNTHGKSVFVYLELWIENKEVGFRVPSYATIVGFSEYWDDKEFEDSKMCYEEKNKKRLELTFYGVFPAGELNVFRHELKAEISKTAKVSSRRIVDMDLATDEQNTYVTFTLLENVPDGDHLLDYDVLTELQKAGGGDKEFDEEMTPEECAARCDAETEFECRSFGSCKQDIAVKPCYLYKYHPNDMAPGAFLPMIFCDYYYRTVIESGVHKTNLYAITALESAVFYNRFHVIHTLANGTKAMYRGINVREIGVDTGGEQFVVGYNKTTLTSSRVTVGVTLEGCESECVNALDEKCESFSYCPSLLECRLTSYFIDEIPSSEMGPMDSCAIYGRSYLTAFIHHPGKVLPVDPDKIGEADTADKCAQTCYSDNDLPCLSFEFCAYEGQRTDDIVSTKCYMFKTHLLDYGTSANLTENAPCDFYTRGYLVDFSKYQNKSLFVEDGSSTDLYIQESHPDECAKFCVEESNFDCRSFDMCTGRPGLVATYCILKSANLQDSNAELEDHMLCDHYSRERYLDGTLVGSNSHMVCEVKPDNGTSTPTEIPVGITTGGAVGLAFGMILLGVLLTVVVLVAYMKYTGKRFDDMHARLT